MLKQAFGRLLPLYIWMSVAGLAGCSGVAPVDEPSPEDSSGFFACDGDQLYYEASGAGFPLLLVSGGSGMDMRQWERVAPRLAESYRVIRVDPRGIGRSDNPTSSYSDAVDLEQLLDHLELEQVGIVGPSSAGGLVLEFALSYPDRVAGVVAAAPFVPGFEFSETMLERLVGFSQAAEEGREAFLDRMFDDPHFIPSPLDSGARPWARTIMAENFDKGAGFDPGLPIALEPPLIEQLAAIRPPVLLVAGALDHPEVLRRNEFLTRKIPVATEERVADAGHNIPIENPEAFLAAVLPFLDQLRQ